jgi:colicin import membrane protein
VFSILKRNPLAAAIAIAMHLAIILLMVFGLDWLEKPQAPKFKVDVVQARVVDAAKVDAEVKRLKQAEKDKKSRADAAKRKELKRLEDLRKKRRLEEKRIADLKKKRIAEEKKKRELAEENKRKEAEAKKRDAAEAKRKAAEEKKRKVAEEKKRKAQEAKKRKQEEQRKIEEQMRADMEAERDATEMELYQARITQAVTDSWLRPIGVGDGLKCTLRIRMATGGNVIAAEVIQSSGNGAFDRSARAAVLKADPLPVPSGRLFERFREMNFVFEPSGGN